MNVKSYLLTAALIISGVISVCAQAPSPDSMGDQQPPPPPREGPRGKDRKFLMNLPPEVQKRFQEAREKALKDPKIQELRKASDKANRDFFEAMRLKMQEIDPGLAEIIKKNVDAEGKRGPEGRGGGGKMKGFQSLTEAQRDQLMAAREKAKDEPAVQAAREKRDAATTPQERQAASEEFHKTMNAAILKIDPSLAPILEKLENASAPPPPPAGAPSAGEEMAPPPPPGQ